MHWVYLLGAGILEVVWAYAMKLSHGFQRPVPTTVMIIAMIGSVVLLTLSMRHLPLGTAYAIWTGIGTLGAFVLGVVMLGEAATATRLVAAALIVAGLVLMKVGTEG
jgi:quaternary ammonium compound-resistance protein SugE